MQDDYVKISVFESAMRLHESLDSSEVARAALRVLPALIEADAWALYIKAEHGDRFDLARAHNPLGFALAASIDLHDESAAVARAITQARGLGAKARLDRLSGGMPVEVEKVALTLPLVSGRRMIGVAQALRRLGKREAEEVYSAEEVRVAELICGCLARALANAQDYQDAARQTLIDDLTRLYNVRHFYQTLYNEIRRARRYDSHVSVVFMDMDGFKRVNDIYGHRAGSITLAEVAQVIKMSVRESDFVARYGGDEFVVMLPETLAKQAVEVAERVRAEIASHRFSGGVGANLYLTACFGIASFPEHASEVDKLIELADAAMYQAKQLNRNTFRLAAS